MVAPSDELCAVQSEEDKATKDNKKADDRKLRSGTNCIGKGTASAVPLITHENPRFSL
jgi:hypothetical protein